MKQYYIKQRKVSLRGRFSVKDETGNDVYFVEGSFLQIPKHYTISSIRGEEIARITKKILSLLPTFYVEMNGHEQLTIKKDISFFKPRYSIAGTSVQVKGDWWDMDFQVLQQGQIIATVNKEWFTWGDSYKVKIIDEQFEALVIALVIAIDCVKADHNAAV